MSENVERVAIALFEEWEKRCQRAQGTDPTTWDVQSDEFKEVWRRYARIAIDVFGRNE